MTLELKPPATAANGPGDRCERPRGSADLLGVDMANDKPRAEEWRTVPDHPDYQVSSLGRVRSYKRPNTRQLGQPRLLKPHADPAGYIRTMFDGTHRYVHWAVATAWHGPCPEGMEVDHRNSIRHDNRPENLRWVTRQENLVGRAGQLADECSEGHPMSGENLYIRPSNGRRECRQCGRNRLKNRPPSHRTCSADDCTREADCRLRTDQPLCEMHYQRSRKAEKRQRATLTGAA